MLIKENNHNIHIELRTGVSETLCLDYKEK